MPRQFDFRLIGAEAPAGQLDADNLLALVQSVREIAMTIGRSETEAESRGRPPKRTQRVARLSIGLGAGSTVLQIRRGASSEALDFDLDEETSFDDSFQEIVEAMTRDERPDWVTIALARSVGKFCTALANSSSTVEFSVDGIVRSTFVPNELDRDQWISDRVDHVDSAVTFVGRLRMVNLDSHRLQVTDDIGNRVSLPDVDNDLEVGRLLNDYVAATGTPEYDRQGRLTQLRGSHVEAAPLPPGVTMGRQPVASLDEILASAPGLQPGWIDDLTEDESSAFLKAIGA